MTIKRAVVFDDSELFCYLFSKFFKKYGVQVTTHEKPCQYFCIQAGVNSCPVTTPCTDFLLTDQQMPDMSGLEFLIRIQQMECKIPDCRKGVISANWTDEDKQKAQQIVPNVFDKSDTKDKVMKCIMEETEKFKVSMND